MANVSSDDEEYLERSVDDVRAGVYFSVRQGRSP